MTPFPTCHSCYTYDESPLPELNLDLLAQIVTSITEKPESWDQGTFFTLAGLEGESTPPEQPKVDVNECGTTMCIAGWAMFHTYGADAYRRSFYTQLDGTPTTEIVERGESIIVKAAALLGLTDLEAQHLFLHTRTNIEQVRQTLDVIVSRRTIPAPDVQQFTSTLDAWSASARPLPVSA